MNLYRLFNFIYGCWYVQSKKWINYGYEDEYTEIGHHLSIFGRRFHWTSH